MSCEKKKKRYFTLTLHTFKNKFNKYRKLKACLWGEGQEASKSLEGY